MPAAWCDGVLSEVDVAVTSTLQLLLCTVGGLLVVKFDALPWLWFDLVALLALGGSSGGWQTCRLFSEAAALAPPSLEGPPCWGWATGQRFSLLLVAACALHAPSRVPKRRRLGAPPPWAPFPAYCACFLPAVAIALSFLPGRGPWAKGASVWVVAATYVAACVAGAFWRVGGVLHAGPPRSRWALLVAFGASAVGVAAEAADAARCGVVGGQAAAAAAAAAALFSAVHAMGE